MLSLIQNYVIFLLRILTYHYVRKRQRNCEETTLLRFLTVLSFPYHPQTYLSNLYLLFMRQV